MTRREPAIASPGHSRAAGAACRTVAPRRRGHARAAAWLSRSAADAGRARRPAAWMRSRPARWTSRLGGCAAALVPHHGLIAPAAGEAEHLVVRPRTGSGTGGWPARSPGPGGQGMDDRRLVWHRHRAGRSMTDPAARSGCRPGAWSSAAGRDRRSRRRRSRSNTMRFRAGTDRSHSQVVSHRRSRSCSVIGRAGLIGVQPSDAAVPDAERHFRLSREGRRAAA